MGLFMEFVVRLSDLEARVVECVGSLIDKEGFELVKIKANSEAGHGHLAFFLDRKGEEAIALDDLTSLNGLLSDVLDVADAEKPFFKKTYNLEVSSPGIERPLTKMSHFEAALEKDIKIRTDGLESLSRSITGIVKQVSDEGVQIESKKNNDTVFVPFIRIRDAHEVFDFSALDPQKPKKRPAKKSKGEE